MRNTSCCVAEPGMRDPGGRRVRRPGAPRRAAGRRALIAAVCLALGSSCVAAADGPRLGERLDGYYAREGNGGSPAAAAGNDIYLKFFDDRWVALLFVPYPYALEVDAGQVARAFAAARAGAASPSYLRGAFGAFDRAATAQIERYGYLPDRRIAFECGALSACTISVGDDMIELVKPGIVNPHIVRYRHVAAE